jgi:1,4-alpha-glucan branching enzyme
VKTGSTIHPMQLVDEAGYFAVLLKRKTIPAHSFLLKKDGSTKEYPNPYAFPSQISGQEEKRFAAGNWSDAEISSVRTR